MDITTLAAAIGIIKQMPDSAASRAEAAAAKAEKYGWQIYLDINDDTLVLQRGGEE